MWSTQAKCFAWKPEDPVNIEKNDMRRVRQSNSRWDRAICLHLPKSCAEHSRATVCIAMCDHHNMNAKPSKHGNVSTRHECESPHPQPAESAMTADPPKVPLSLILPGWYLSGNTPAKIRK